MKELTELLKEIVNGSSKQDQAILDLCHLMIKRIVALESVVTDLHTLAQIQTETIRLHSHTMATMRETLKAYTDKRVN